LYTSVVWCRCQWTCS